MKMKKFNKSRIMGLIAICLVAIMSVGLLASCNTTQTSSNSSSNADASSQSGEYKVGVIQYISHPSLDNCYNGVEAALKENTDLNITIDRQIGSDTSADADCAAYAAKMVSQNYDLIVAIATPAATSAFAATENSKIPVVFCAVSDPVSAELVKSMDEPGDLCTGTSDVLNLDAQVDLIQSIQPDAKKIGVLYTTSEANSITQLNNLKEIAEKRGMTVEASGVQNAADIPSAASALCGKVDCINNFTDNNVVNNLSVLLDAANSANIPVYGSEVEQVKNGCLAAVSIDYIALGKTTGNMAVDILNGGDPKTMAVKTISDATPVINSDVVSSLGLTIPEKYNSAETVTTNK